MSSYWKDYFDMKSVESKGSLLKQVEKTIGGEEVGDDQVSLIVGNIVEKLNLNTSDKVADLCCGNGLITQRIVPFVDSVTGIDFSSGLINVANEHNDNEKIRYVCSDVTNINVRDIEGAKKMYMNESLQHLTPEMFKKMLGRLSDLEAGFLFFISGIPDIEHLKDFYDSEEKFAYYLKCEEEGKSHIGHWWSKSDVLAISESMGFEAKICIEDPELNTAYYRFDLLLKKSD